MRVYFIDSPYVSTGLRRTYHKKLEVYSGLVDSSKTTIPAYGYTVSADSIYKYMKKGWVEKPYGSNKVIRLNNLNSIHTSMPTFNQLYHDPVFSTLELAQAAKLFLIQRMANKYEQELAALRELFRKNVPNVEEPLKELKENYPEYFI